MIIDDEICKSREKNYPAITLHNVCKLDQWFCDK